MFVNMSNNEVVIIDYGVGNIFSVRQGLEEAGASPIVTSDKKKKKWFFQV